MGYCNEMLNDLELDTVDQTIQPNEVENILLGFNCEQSELNRKQKELNNRRRRFNHIIKKRNAYYRAIQRFNDNARKFARR